MNKTTHQHGQKQTAFVNGRPGVQQNPHKEFVDQVRTWIALGMAGPHAVFPYISPAEAKALLTFSNGNRSIRESAVQQYMRDIENDVWPLTHQGMGFTVDGVLYDGHHRLTAISRIADDAMSLRVQITFGMPKEAVGATDSGVSRSVADRFLLGRGIRLSSLELATVRAALRLEQPSPASHTRYSDQEILDAHARFSPALAAIRSAMAARFPASLWGAILFAHEVSPDQTTQFALDVAHGADLSVGSPALCLREWVRNNANSAGQQNQLAISTRTLYALRALLDGRPLTKFAVKDGYHVIEWFRSQKRIAK